jgi:hypothetical protein
MGVTTSHGHYGILSDNTTQQSTTPNPVLNLMAQQQAVYATDEVCSLFGASFSMKQF